jgi:hypothetical protein
VKCSCGQCTCPEEVPPVIRRNDAREAQRSPLPLTDKERKALPVLTFLCEYFPDAIVELTKLCVAGNIQHNPELAPTDIKWAREKSADQLNTAFRHIFERKCGIVKDTDGQFHAIKAMWRCGAQAQLDIEESRK